MTASNGSGSPRRSYSKALTAEMQKAVEAHKEQVYGKICAAKELYSLIVRWGEGKPLTEAQEATVRTRLLRICQEIPELSTHLSPYGSILLAILLKSMPFNIIPATVISRNSRSCQST